MHRVAAAHVLSMLMVMLRDLAKNTLYLLDVYHLHDAFSATSCKSGVASAEIGATNCYNECWSEAGCCRLRFRQRPLRDKVLLNEGYDLKTQGMLLRTESCLAAP